MKKAFTLVELLIVVSILGILGAIVLPAIKANAQEAKESNARTNLHMLRNAIEIFAIQHNDIPPGYLGNNPANNATIAAFSVQLTHINFGKYLSEMPENPFNNKYEAMMLQNIDVFPAEPTETDTYGWIYKPATKMIKLNWAGTDSQGAAYFDY